MNDFTLHIPTKILFGPDQLAAFAKEVKSIGQTALLVTGGGSVKKLGYLDTVLAAFEKEEIEVKEFSGVEPNPLSETINECAQHSFYEGVEVVVALGGGSVMDAAKAIAAMIHDVEEDVWEFVKGGPKEGQFQNALPICAIPTTAATASEVTPYAVISNKEAKGKSVLAYEFLKPRVSWLNPEFTTKLPATTTADGAADILSHVFENYLLGGSDSQLADKYSEAVMSTVLETLPKLTHNPEDIDARGDLLWASSMALNGFHLAGRMSSEFVLHSIEHAMSAYYHELAHGRGLATLFPAYFRWLWNNNRGRKRLSRLGITLFDVSPDNENAGLEFIERFESWLSRNGLLQTAEDIGIPRSSFREIAEYSVKVYGAEKHLNALGPMTIDDIVEVLELTLTQSK